MAELWNQDGCKFVTLVRRLNASDKAIRQALDYLLRIGWVMRNPGYGHPWRPEYILTEAGVHPGRVAAKLAEAVGDEGAEITRERWPLVAIAALSRGPLRYGDLRRSMEPVTPRALTLALRRLLEHHLIERSVDTGGAVAVAYRLSTPGRRLAAILDELTTVTE
jgi:DNA-binding HxlR family transcriptional regulator